MTGTEADSKLLRKAVKEDALQQIIRPLMNWYSYPSVYFIEYLLIFQFIVKEMNLLSVKKPAVGELSVRCTTL